MRSHSTRWLLGALVAGAFGGALLAGCGQSHDATALRRAANRDWSSVVRCLQRHTQFAVTQPDGTESPNAGTDAVLVLRKAKPAPPLDVQGSGPMNGNLVAYLDNTELGWALTPETVFVDTIAGPLQYGLTPRATSRDQMIVNGCVNASGIDTVGCYKFGFPTPVTCAFDQAVFDAYKRATVRVPGSHGSIDTTLMVHDQSAGATVKLVCEQSSGMVTCIPSGHPHAFILFPS